MITMKQLIEEATKFITVCYQELGKDLDIEGRLVQIEAEILETGTYEHTFEELVHGARMAWRNSNRCIGRLFWNKMHILDAREVNDTEGVYNALIHHIRYATNDGKIKPTITIFKQHSGEKNNIRIYNHQLIRYAGYETAAGSLVILIQFRLQRLVKSSVGMVKEHILMYCRSYFLLMETSLYAYQFLKKT